MARKKIINQSILDKKERKRKAMDFTRDRLLMGESAYEIKKKWKNREYDIYDVPRECIEFYATCADKVRNDLVMETYLSCEIENKDEREGQKNLMYSRFLSIYKEARERGDLQAARQILENISKLLGLNEADKVQVTSEIINVKLV